MIKNLSQLKKALAPGADFVITAHCRPECVGETRRVNLANTTGIYSINPDDPTSKASTANCGKGSWLGWSKAPFWSFEGDTAMLYDSDTTHTPEHIIIGLKLAGGETA